MTVDRIVHIAAGLMVLAGIALSHYVHPKWLALPIFVGLNLLSDLLYTLLDPRVRKQA